MNCLVYVNLNMVRAGEVSHPAEWKWCGHDELVGTRVRNRILNLEGLLQSLDLPDVKDLRDWYSDALQRRLTARKLIREWQWTESLAVGSQEFVKHSTDEHPNRRSFALDQLSGEAGSGWAVREEKSPYNAD